MKLSEHWLRELVDPELSTAQLADLLTFGGIEVEAVEPAAPAFDRIVVAEVLSVEKHPKPTVSTSARSMPVRHR